MARSKEGWATYGTLPCTYHQRVIYRLSDVEWKDECEYDLKEYERKNNKEFDVTRWKETWKS